MAIRLTHFDTKFRQDLDTSAELEHTVAEYLFPKTRFALGSIDDDVTPDDLREYRGMKLQFASRERMYFAEGEVSSLLYPNASDAVAYGSLPFTPNQSFRSLRQVRILVVDDATGENGHHLPNQEAKRLVGDCFGKISLDLAEDLTKRTDTPFQYRLGIKPQPGHQVYRIAKGTLSPDERLANDTSIDGSAAWATERWLEGKDSPEADKILQALERPNAGELSSALARYELIIPTSSFKGRQGDEALQPGEYILDVGIGLKSLASYGVHSLGTQVLVNYPEAVETEIVPQTEKQATLLASMQSDIYDLAQQYLADYQKRQASRQQGEEEDALFNSLDDLFPLPPDQREVNLQQITARLLQTDLSGHAQLLEHPFFMSQFRDYVKNRWLDLATGRSVKFSSGLAQPEFSLAKDEVCISTIADGEEVILTRSPLINSNGVIVLKNKHVPRLMHLKGTIYLHPTTAAQHLQADFDGDRLAFERAAKYPILTAEIKEALKPENRYPDVVKLDKIPYRGSLEEIAVSAVSLEIGKLANQIQKYVALRTEIQRVPDECLHDYLNQVSSHYQQLLHRNQGINPPGVEPEFQPYLDEIEHHVRFLASLPKNPLPTQLERARDSLDTVMYFNVALLQNQLQVAVDGPKSARRPDEALYRFCQSLAGYREVSWLRDKKNPQMYQTQLLESKGYSSIDRLIRTTNFYWQKYPLQARPSEQFRGLFPEPSRSDKILAKEIRDTINSSLQLVARLRALREKHPQTQNSYAEILSDKSLKTIYLTEIDPTNPLLERESLRVELAARPDSRSPHRLVAVAAEPGRDGREGLAILGLVMESSRQEHDLKPGMVVKSARIKSFPGIKTQNLEAHSENIRQYQQQLLEEFACPERQSEIAGALWHVNFWQRGREDFRYPKGHTAFTVFPEAVARQLQTWQFLKLKLVGAQYNDYRERQWQGETMSVEVGLAEITTRDGIAKSKRAMLLDGKVLAPFAEQSGQLPVGTKLKAKITSDPGSSVAATTPKGNQIKLNSVEQYAFQGHQWQDEPTTLTVQKVARPRKPLYLALIDGQPLGSLAPETVNQMRIAGIELDKRSYTVPVSLRSAPGTTISVEVLPETVEYPWQLRETQRQQERSLNQLREHYRELYLNLVRQVKKDERHLAAEPDHLLELEVAVRVYAQTGDKREVAMVLSQSDTVRGWKMLLPDPDTLDYRLLEVRYREDAKNYIEAVCSKAVELDRQRQGREQ